jgi:triacylglycerol esterase/lipase EstA (alpha/beta hydrolase family)
MASARSLAAPFTAPPISLLLSEPLRAALDFCAGKFARSARPVGDRHPVVVFPGLGGAPFTTAHLRRFLDDSGFEAHCWGRGVNTGPDGAFDEWLDGLVGDVRDLHARTGRKVSLVGWSLGGVYAREIAKLAPDAVRQVITLGTPFAAMGGGATHAETIYKLLGGNTSQLTPELQARLREAPPVPTTSVFSKSDGVVCWRGCLQPDAPQAENVEVGASHLGMVTHPQVLRVVADRLAQPEGGWKPWRRRARATQRRIARRGRA